MMRRDVIDLLGRNVLVAGIYLALGLLVLRALAPMGGMALPIWPAAGVAFALAHLCGWRVLPGIAAGTLAYTAISLALAGQSAATVWTMAAVIALGASLQAHLGAFLVRRLVGPRLLLQGHWEVMAMLLLAGPVACVVNPTVGMLAQLAGEIISANRAPVGWITWWAGDAIGVLVFGPLTLMFAPGQQLGAGMRRWKVMLPSLAITVGLFLLFAQDASVERDEAMQQVQQLAGRAATELKVNITRHEEVLHFIGGLQESSRVVTAEEFRTFTAGPLSRFANLHALSWDAVIPRDELPAFEASQRAQPGLESYTVTERSDSGGFQPVTPREYYVAVQYIEPFEANRAALGFDIRSNPKRASAIRAALEAGEPRATAPIDLVQDADAQRGMLVLLPIRGQADPASDPQSRHAAVRGFAVAAYRIGDLVKETFSSSAWESANIRLVDVTDGAAVDIADLPSRAPMTVDVMSDAPFTAAAPIDVYGRTWQVEVTPTSGPLTEPNLTRTALLLGIAVFVVFLLQTLVLLLTGLEQKALLEAAESSHAASHDALTGLLSRREFVRRFERLLHCGPRESGRILLMFCDLDGFKLVNDGGGHEAGDRLLLAVASTLSASVGEQGFVARLGGDEFAVVLARSPTDRGIALANSIIEKVSRCEVISGGLVFSVGMSIGITVIDPQGPKDLDALMRQADAACYAAKRAGRGNVRAFSQEMTACGWQ